MLKEVKLDVWGVAVVWGMEVDTCRLGTGIDVIWGLVMAMVWDLRMVVVWSLVVTAGLSVHVWGHRQYVCAILQDVLLQPVGIKVIVHNMCDTSHYNHLSHFLNTSLLLPTRATISDHILAAYTTATTLLHAPRTFSTPSLSLIILELRMRSN